MTTDQPTNTEEIDMTVTSSTIEPVTSLVIDPTRHRPRMRYDWDLFMNGEEHTAIWQEDFSCGIASFVALLHQKGREKGTTVRTSTTGVTVTFTYQKA